MPASLSKSLGLSSTLKKMDEEAAAIKVVTGNKQGIVSILGSDCERTKAASLRRTLSADMSSKKWLEQQGFSSTMKKIASVDEIFPLLGAYSSSSSSSSQSSSDGEEEDYRESRRGQLEIWSSIQEEEKKKKTELENPGQFDIWTSIQSQKVEDSSKSGTIDPAAAAAPYIHPLVKRASSLSEKSLEICTENLGSETGSDGFSSYPPSETSELDQEEEEQDHHQQQQQQQEQEEELQVLKYSKKVQPRSFPPPLPSLARGDGPSLRMQCHRKDGRLVLEAVSVPTQNYFSAQRQDGRLLLTFVNSTTTSAEQDQPKGDSHQEIVEDDKEDRQMGEWSDDEEFGESDDEEEEEEEGQENECDEDEVENIEKESIIIGKVEMEIGVVVEDQKATTPKVTRTEVMNVHRAAVMMNKLIRLANRNPTWPKRINEVIKFEDHDATTTPLSKSFPLPPRGGMVPRPIPSSPPPSATAAAATFNVYENCWRTKQPNTIFSTPPLLPKPSPLKNNHNHNNNNNNNNINYMPIFSRSTTTTTTKTTTTLKANDQQQQLLATRGDKGSDYLVLCKEPRRSLLFWEPHCIATS